MNKFDLQMDNIFYKSYNKQVLLQIKAPKLSTPGFSDFSLSSIHMFTILTILSQIILMNNHINHLSNPLILNKLIQTLQNSDSKNSMKEPKEATADIGLFQQNYLFKAWRDLKDSIFDVLYVLLDGEEQQQQQQPMFGLIFESGVDYFQMLAFPFDNSVMSAWNGGDTLNNVSNLFSKLNIMTYLPGVSFDTFLILLYALILLIILVIIDIIYVSYSFSKKRFRFTWPLIILAKLVPLFVTVFFLPITQTLLSVVNCSSSEEGYQVMNSFPDVVCWKGLHLFHSAVTLLFVAIFVFISSVVALALFEPRMASKKLTARQNSTGEVVFIMNKIICQLIFSFNPFKDQWVYSAILFGLSGWLYWTYNMSDPFYNKKASKFFRIVSSYYFWTNFMLLISQLLSPLGFNGGLVIWISGLPFIGIIIGFQHKSNIDQLFSFNLKFKSGEQLEGHLRYVLQLLQSQEEDKNSYMLVTGYIEKHKQVCVQDDCPLKVTKKLNKSITDKEDLNQKFLLQIERMYKLGIKKYPNCTRLRLSFAFFQLQRLKNKNKAYQQFSFALKTDPAFEEEFIIYRFKKIIRQNLQNNENGENSSDLIEIIRFQNHISLFQQAMVRSSRLHKDFWTELKEQTPDLKKLSIIGAKITKTINMVKQNYEQISKINNSVPEVLYCYSIYLLKITKDQIQGQRMVELSKKIYLQKVSNSKKKIIEEEEKSEVVIEPLDQAMICVSSKKENFGKVINLNSLFRQLTGYQREEIVQRNFQKILPQVFKDIHEERIKLWIQSTQQSGQYVNTHRQGYIKLKSGFVLPVEYMVVAAAQTFTVYFKNISGYRNCCHLILDFNKVIRDSSILGNAYFGLDKWILNEMELSIQQFFDSLNLEQLLQKYKSNKFQYNLIYKKKQIPCSIKIEEVFVRSNHAHSLNLQKQKGFSGNRLIGYYVKITLKNKENMEERQHDQSFDQLNENFENSNQDILQLYEDPNIFDILISNLAQTKTKNDQPQRFKLTYKIKTMRLLNNEIKMVYDQNSNNDFDNNEREEDEEDDLQIMKLNDNRYQEKIRSAINTKLNHEEVSHLTYSGFIFAFFIIAITIVEMLFCVNAFESYFLRSENLQNIANQSNQLSKYLTSTLDNNFNFSSLYANIQTHDVQIQSPVTIEVKLDHQKSEVMSMRNAFLYFYSKIEEFYKVQGSKDLDIVYQNYITNLYPAIQQMKLQSNETIEFQKFFIIVLFFFALSVSSVFFFLWVYNRLKIQKKKANILLWFLDIPVSYVTFLGENCDSYLKNFISIKEVMNKGIKIQDGCEFEDYKEIPDKEQQIQEQQKARKTLILKQRKLNFISRLSLTHLKLGWILIFGMVYSIVVLSQNYALKNYESFLMQQWIFSGRSILWANSIHFSMSLIDNGKEKINGINIEEFKKKNILNFENTMSNKDLLNFNQQILWKENDPNFEQIVSAYTTVYYSDMCTYLKEQKSDCGQIALSSLRGGYRTFTMYIRNHENNSTNDIRQANQKYASRAILSMINVWKQNMKEQADKATNVVSIAFYVYIFAGMLSFFIIWLIYLSKINNEINEAIRMLNMIPFKLLSSSRKETRNFIVWIIREANKKKHELE